MDTQTDSSIVRIPRPEQATNLSLMGNQRALAENLAQAYIRGTFPKPGTYMPLTKFRTKYHIPFQVMQAAITEAFTASPKTLLDKGTDILDKALAVLASPQHKASRLTQFLEDKVYQPGKAPGHLLVQNLIGSINLERQGADSIVRFLEKALGSDLVIDAQQEDLISREEAIALISSENLQLAEYLQTPGKHRDTGLKDLSDLEEHLEAHPEIPNVRANIQRGEDVAKIPRVNSEYTKRKDTPPPQVVQPPTILPA